MLALLARSVQFGHRRLTLIRCMLVERMGGQVSPETVRYCQRVAGSIPHEMLEKIMRQVAAASIAGLPANMASRSECVHTDEW
jgi:hypothetical protein